jgi:aryl-phospho-beta-D-glucosidase BglC (GH1 family)
MEKNKVYVIQDVPGTREGRPKINIIGASQYGSLKSSTSRKCTNNIKCWTCCI